MFYNITLGICCISLPITFILCTFRKEAQYEVNTNEQGQNLNLQTSAGQPVD